MRNNNLYLYQRLDRQDQNLNNAFGEDDNLDVALVSHDYSDRYELSISNNND